MTEFRIDFEWESPGDARGDDLRATWARYQVIVGGELITRVIDERSRSERTGLYAPLLPMAEWIVDHWFHIFGEVGSKFTRSEAYWKRHNLRSASEGYVYPDVSFLPSGTHVDIIWRRYRSQHAPLEFVSDGHARVSADSLRETLRTFVDAVCQRLTDLQLLDTYLQQEWVAIQELDPEEEHYANVAAGLGLDPFNITRKAANALAQIDASLPTEVVSKVVAVSDLSEVGDQARWIADAIAQLSSCEFGLTKLPEISRSFKKSVSSGSKLEPYIQGLKTAQFVRRKLELSNAPIPEFRDLLIVFGSSGDEDTCVLTREDHKKVHAVGVGGDAPRFLVARHRRDSSRFAFCRGIYNYIYSLGSTTIVTDSYFDEDRASRAFAAEFLAPVQGIKDRIREAVLVEEDVMGLAEAFGVSVWVIEHQIENNRLAQIVYDAPHMWRVKSVIG